MKEINIKNPSKIRRFLVMVCALVLTIITIFSYSFAAKNESEVFPFKARINFLDPTKVKLKSFFEEKFHEIKPLSYLYESDHIKTLNEGITEIIFNRQNVIRLNQDTELVIQKISQAGNPIEIKLITGEIWVHSYNQPIIIHTDKSSTIVPSATANFNFQKGKLITSTHRHISHLSLHSENKKNINFFSLPSNTQVTIYEASITDKYRLLSSKKLIKQLKLTLFTKENAWVKTNVNLDYSLKFIDPKLPNIVDKEHFWYPAKRLIEDINVKLTANEKLEKKKQIELLKKRILELETYFIKNPQNTSQEKKDINIEELQQEIIDILNIFSDEIKLSFIDFYFEKFKYVTFESSLYPLKEFLTGLKKETVENPLDKHEFLYFQVLQEINNLEDLVHEKVLIKNSEEINEKFQKMIEELSVEYISYKEGDMLRNIWLYFLISNTRAVDSYFLETNDLIEKFHIDISFRDKEESAEDLPIEILENHLIITDNLIEKNQNFKLASEYLNKGDITTKINILPSSYAPKKLLSDFVWLVTQKITLKITSRDARNGTLSSVLQKQKKIQKLQDELEESLSPSAPKKEIIQNVKKLIADIINNFEEINIKVKKENITLISEDQFHFLITNVTYRDTDILKLKYNLHDDTIFELETQVKKISTVIPREDLPNFFKEEEKDLGILSDTLTESAEIISAPDDEISTLIKEITKRELDFYKIEIDEKNVTPLNEDATEVSIKRGYIDQKLKIYADFIYDRVNKEIREIEVVSEPVFTIKMPIKLHVLHDTLKEKQEYEFEVIEKKESIVSMFSKQNFSLGIHNISLLDESLENVMVKNVRDKNTDFEFTATFDSIKNEFSTITFAQGNFAKNNLSFSGLKEEILKYNVKNDLSSEGINIVNLKIRATGKDFTTALVENISINTLLVSFEYNIIKKTCTKIIVLEYPKVTITKETLEEVIGQINAIDLADLIEEEEEEEKNGKQEEEAEGNDQENEDI